MDELRRCTVGIFQLPTLDNWMVIGDQARGYFCPNLRNQGMPYSVKTPANHLNRQASDRSETPVCARERKWRHDDWVVLLRIARRSWHRCGSSLRFAWSDGKRFFRFVAVRHSVDRHVSIGHLSYLYTNPLFSNYSTGVHDFRKYTSSGSTSWTHLAIGAMDRMQLLP